jgi:hypothetical protein
LWQYGGDKAAFPILGMGQGAEYGVEHESIDLDAYNGTVEKMRADLNIGDDPGPLPAPVPEPVSVPVPDIPEPPISENTSFRLPVKVIALPSLRIRSGPGTNFPQVGRYANGQEIVLLDIRRDGADWWGLTDRGWVAGKWRGERHTDL